MSLEKATSSCWSSRRPRRCSGTSPSRPWRKYLSGQRTYRATIDALAMLVEAADVLEQDLAKVRRRRGLLVVAELGRHGGDSGRKRAVQSLARSDPSLFILGDRPSPAGALAGLVDVRLVLGRVALRDDRQQHGQNGNGDEAVADEEGATGG